MQTVRKNKNSLSLSQFVLHGICGDSEASLQHNNQLYLSVQMRGEGIVSGSIKAQPFSAVLVKYAHKYLLPRPVFNAKNDIYYSILRLNLMVFKIKLQNMAQM